MGPNELTSLGLDPARYHKAGANEYHGPCPRCGGKDRFVIFTDGIWPHWNMWCRQCGWKVWPDQLNEALKAVSPDDRARWDRQRAQAEQADRERRQRQLDTFTASELWEAFARKMGDPQRAWWARQGIGEEWQNYWHLGWTNSAPISGSPEAYTIPYFDGGRVVNMQYRLAHVDGANKYRWAGLGYTSPFVALPDVGMDGEALVVEGAKKAMVVASRLWECGAGLQVCAVPSKSDFANIAKVLDKMQRVYVLLDPDAHAESIKLAAKIGKRARLVSLDEKVDDRVLQTGINAVLNRLPYARAWR